jgi:hypothetical protein
VKKALLPLSLAALAALSLALALFLAPVGETLALFVARSATATNEIHIGGVSGFGAGIESQSAPVNEFSEDPEEFEAVPAIESSQKAAEEQSEESGDGSAADFAKETEEESAGSLASQPTNEPAAEHGAEPSGKSVQSSVKDASDARAVGPVEEAAMSP